MSKRAKVDTEDMLYDVPSAMQNKSYLGDKIHYVNPLELHVNPLNKVFFRRETGVYFEKLSTDIERRGIKVPLIVRNENDKTLLAGHNRLEIALSLGLKSVPVQFLTRSLTQEEEQEFLIKDNLLRRQFSNEEWIIIYRNVEPTFDEELFKDNRGGDRKSSKAQEQGNENGKETLAERLARKTGLKENTVQSHLSRHKKREKQEHQAPKKIKIGSANFDFPEQAAKKSPASRKATTVMVPLQKNNGGHGVVYLLTAVVAKTEHTDRKAYRSEQEAEAKSAAFKRSLLKRLGTTAKILDVRVKELVVVVDDSIE